MEQVEDPNTDWATLSELCEQERQMQTAAAHRAFSELDIMGKHIGDVTANGVSSTQPGAYESSVFDVEGLITHTAVQTFRLEDLIGHLEYQHCCYSREEFEAGASCLTLFEFRPWR